MDIRLTPWTAQKFGLPPEAYEDAWNSSAGKTARELVTHRLCIGIADGASEALLAKYWAALVTEHLAASGPYSSPMLFLQALRRAVGEWDRCRDAYVADRIRTGRPIQWFEEPGLMRGSFATALAFDLTGPNQSWRALSVGDSCVFQIRDGELMKAYPLERAEQFDTSPALMPSVVRDWSVVARNVDMHRGRWEPGDEFFLATDAASAWFLSEFEAGHKPWHDLRELGTDLGRSFESWLDDERSAGRMKNDDVTLLRVEVN
jgi:hypothetical protein